MTLWHYWRLHTDPISYMRKVGKSKWASLHLRMHGKKFSMRLNYILWKRFNKNPTLYGSYVRITKIFFMRKSEQTQSNSNENLNSTSHNLEIKLLLFTSLPKSEFRVPPFMIIVFLTSPVQSYNPRLVCMSSPALTNYKQVCATQYHIDLANMKDNCHHP